MHPAGCMPFLFSCSSFSRRGPGVAGARSLVDDPRFFLSPSGKTDPAAELLATLDGLFDNTSAPAAFCRFPARYAWLAGKLGIDPPRIPRPPPWPGVDNILRP